MKFSELLTKHRLKSKYSTTDLSIAVGYSNDTVLQQLQRGHPGRKPPPFPKVRKIAEILNIPESDRYEFFKAAFEERLGKDGKEFQEMLQGLQPHVDRKAFKKTLTSELGQVFDDDFIEVLSQKNLLKIIEIYKTMPPEKQAALLEVCKSMSV